jgi:hypothetical protein
MWELWPRDLRIGPKRIMSLKWCSRRSLLMPRSNSDLFPCSSLFQQRTIPEKMGLYLKRCMKKKGSNTAPSTCRVRTSPSPRDPRSYNSMGPCQALAELTSLDVWFQPLTKWKVSKSTGSLSLQPRRQGASSTWGLLRLPLTKFRIQLSWLTKQSRIRTFLSLAQ